MSRWDRERLLAAPPPAFRRPRVVGFQEVDAAGIVFYGRFFDWFHDVYVDALADSGHPLPQALREQRWIAPLVHAAADYLSPLRFGDRIEVGLVGADATADRLSLGWRVTAGERIAAVGVTVHVFVSPATFERAPMPDTLRSWFTGR
ncbi:MAG: thioesterase family protein [Myxococcota bacterium]